MKRQATKRNTGTKRAKIARRKNQGRELGVRLTPAQVKRWEQIGMKKVRAAVRAKKKRNIAPGILAAGAASGLGSYLGTKHGMRSRNKTRRKNAKASPARPIASGRPVKASDYFNAIKKGYSPREARTVAEEKRYGFKVKRGKKRESFGGAFMRLLRGNPEYKAIPKAQRARVSAKIAKLRKEGVPQKQAVATALSMARAKRLGPKGGYKRNASKKGSVLRGRRNPTMSGDLDQAAKLYEKFHGRGAKEVVNFKRVIEDQTYTGLGKLVSLILHNGEQITWEKSEQPMLAADPGGRQLYVIGGNQDLKLNGNRDWLDLGHIVQIEYFTQKSFDNFEPIIYFHKFGEDDEQGGCKPRRPRLVYDSSGKQCHIVGGGYKIKGVGIVN